MGIKGGVFFFGEKDAFAIQLEVPSSPDRCKLCFWVEGKKMGSFSKGGDLKYSIKAYNYFSGNKEQFYFSEFEHMDPTQITNYLLSSLFVFGQSQKKENQEEYERRRKMILFWGPQFTNDGCSIVTLYNDNEVFFIYTPPKKVESKKYIVDYGVFSSVFKKYISFCSDHKLV